MNLKLTYVIRFVRDMDAAVAFHRDVLGLPLRFQSPGWSEFDTGSVTLALHPETTDCRHGDSELGLRVDDLEAWARDMKAKGYRFTRDPAPEHGMLLARFADADGVEYSVSGPMAR